MSEEQVVENTEEQEPVVLSTDKETWAMSDEEFLAYEEERQQLLEEGEKVVLDIPVSTETQLADVSAQAIQEIQDKYADVDPNHPDVDADAHQARIDYETEKLVAERVAEFKAKQDQEAINEPTGTVSTDTDMEESDDSSKSQVEPEEGVLTEDQVRGLLDDYDSYVESVSPQVQNALGSLDSEAQQILIMNPQARTTLEGHIESGTYQQVMGVVQQLRSRADQSIAGMSDLQAYEAVGNYMSTNNMLKQAPRTPPKPTPARRTPPKATRPAKGRNHAYSPKKTANKNPWAMSDAEIMRMTPEEFANYGQ